jgi:small-conductance mechanosensitive channel
MWDVLWNSLLLFLPRLIVSLVVLVVFWGMSNAAQRLAHRLVGVRQVDSDLTLLLGAAAKVVLLLFGAITALGTLGIDVTALVAGLGLTGFAVGFALRDIISNTLSGILIIIYKPFRKGDRITVTSLEGTVIDVNLRYTVLEAEGKTIFIPNSSLFTNPIIVVSLARSITVESAGAANHDPARQT